MAALQRIHPQIGKGTRLMMEEVAMTLRTFRPLMIALINYIADISESLVLVLDDYHLIQASSVHELVSILIEHMTPQIHLVIAYIDIRIAKTFGLLADIIAPERDIMNKSLPDSLG